MVVGGDVGRVRLGLRDDAKSECIMETDFCKIVLMLHIVFEAIN